MSKSVLLVEDEPNIGEAIRFLLKRDGHDVRVLSDGHEALLSLNQALPDLLILDLMLPGASGLEILRSLRADPRSIDLPILMLTAKGQERDREAAQEAQVSAFMTKPFSNADLRATVRKLLGVTP